MKVGRKESKKGKVWRIFSGTPVYTYLYIGLISLAVSACKKENPYYNVHITVLNAVPDANSFEIFAGGGKISTDGLFGIPAYNIEVPAVADSIQWKITGRSFFDSSFLADLPNGQDFTLLFYDSASRYRPFLVKDNWQQPESQKQGYIRFFPMIVNANALTLTNDTGKVLITNRSFGDFAAGKASFTAIDSFTTKLRLYNNNTLIDSLPNTRLTAGKSYSLYAVGVLNEKGDKRPRMILHQHE